VAIKVMSSCARGAAELGRLALVGEFFFDRPVAIVANEDALIDS
jgi:hypothetical protein